MGTQHRALRSVFNIEGHPQVAEGAVALNSVQRKASMGLVT